MSVKIMSRVWDSAQYEGGTLLVLLALADWSNDEGWAWPGIPALAKKARLEARQVQRIIKKLETDGVLEIEHRRGRNQTNRYHINTSKCRVLEKVTSEEEKATLGGKNLSPVSDDPSVVTVSTNHHQDARAKKLTKPRLPGSKDDRNDKSPKFGIELIRVLPDDWLEEQRVALSTEFPLLVFDDIHSEWCEARERDGSIGKFNCRLPTLVQYAADIRIFFRNWNRNHQGRNGNNGNGKQQSNFETASERNVRLLKSNLARYGVGVSANSGNGDRKGTTRLLATATEPRGIRLGGGSVDGDPSGG